MSVDMNKVGSGLSQQPQVGCRLLRRMERLWEPLPLSREQYPKICLVETVVVNIYTVRVFPGSSLNFQLCLFEIPNPSRLPEKDLHSQAYAGACEANREGVRSMAHAHRCQQGFGHQHGSTSQTLWFMYKWITISWRRCNTEQHYDLVASGWSFSKGVFLASLYHQIRCEAS